MPALIFLTKFGIAMALLASQLSSLTDARLFPVDRRANALGFVNILAQAWTSLVPIINEFEESTPIVYLNILLAIAFLTSLTFSIPESSPLQRRREAQQLLELKAAKESSKHKAKRKKLQR